MTSDSATLTKLDDLLAAIRGYDDPRRAGAEWKQVYKLLSSAGLPAARVTGVVGMRDAAGLETLIDQIRSPLAAALSASADTPDADTCRKALHAFRKRLALTVLDDESKLGRSPLTKGGGAEAAIVPPDEWPHPVWQELVRQGRLRCIGHGLYELVKQ